MVKGCREEGGGKREGKGNREGRQVRGGKKRREIEQKRGDRGGRKRGDRRKGIVSRSEETRQKKWERGEREELKKRVQWGWKVKEREEGRGGEEMERMGVEGEGRKEAQKYKGEAKNLGQKGEQTDKGKERR